ncbi:gamma-glutamyltransferase [Streptomyces violascens]|uniref:Gamma-glutamyltransferase n=2 Tax=Streptomyces violascens TaxID=67381 RepID=A0ABQ3QRZ1_9ACTN|nr:gamma-glutamyltransferase [Streptomyces violascens]GGT84629.1 gamma-glutamyltransferase [Streptomyces violascens]GHI40027.1 gamma-glutamyltransferase [Streptomyces violascens]
MVSTTHWLASQSAMAVLEDGGNAYDAAVAAGFVLHVVQPHLNGPAGEVPIILAPVSGQVRVLCGQGPAPGGATMGHYRSLGLDLVPGTGPLAAAVPGAFDAWMVLLRDHGTKPLAEVLKYAIGYAEHGHPASAGLGRTIEAVRELFETEWTTSAELYLPAPRPGALFRNPALAQTWRTLLRESAGTSREAVIEAARRIWREGFIGEAIAGFAAKPAMDTTGRRHASALTGDDLAGYEAHYESPVSYDWNGWTLCKAGPWSQGPVFLQQLALLPDGFAYDTPDYLHSLVEGTKLAMADREAWYGDAGDVPLADLLSRSYNDRRRALIDGKASHELRPGSPEGRTPRLPDQPSRESKTGDASRHSLGAGEPTVSSDGLTRGDTCHLDVVDRWGNMVAATPSGGWFQSNPVIPALGFPLGTRLQMAWLQPGLPNSLTPGRRPRTTLSPSLALRDGTAVMAFGTPGGDQQDQWSLHFFLAVALGGLSLQAAIDAPNWHNSSFPSSFHPRAMHAGRLTVEARIGEAHISALRERGHDVKVAGPWSQGRLCAVARDPQSGVLSAAADSRGMQGYAVGR